MAVIGITGGCGYIGGALVQRLHREGAELVLVDNFTGPVSTPPEDLPVLRTDFWSSEALRALADVDAVAHLGAVSGVMPCAEDPEGTRAVNVRGTAELVEWCRSRTVPIAFASSLAVVGVPDRIPVTEDTPPAPTHEYARQKAEGEQSVLSLARDGIPGVVLRMSNVYGSYRVGRTRVAKGNVLNVFARQAAAGVLRVNAPGTQRRDFVHLEDVVACWASALKSLAEGEAPGDLNRLLVASGVSRSVTEVAEAVRAAWTRVRPEERAPRIEVVPNPRGEVELLDPRFRVDPHRSMSALGLTPKHNLETDLDAILRTPAPEE